jgi:hypothetical protein
MNNSNQSKFLVSKKQYFHTFIISKMEAKTKWTRIIFIIGIVALTIGAIDPLEGSVIIAVGSALIALSTNLSHDRHRKLFLATLIMIVVGIIFMFFLSSLGGFGGKSTLSWWWSILIVPYPAGWLISITVLISRTFKKPDKEVNL